MGEVPDEFAEFGDATLVDCDDKGGGVVESPTVGSRPRSDEQDYRALVAGRYVEQVEVEGATDEDTDVGEEAEDGVTAAMIAGEGATFAGEVSDSVFSDGFDDRRDIAAIEGFQ